MEHRHNLIAVNDRLQQSFVVLLLQVDEFLAHHSEVFEEHLLSSLVLAGDIGLAESHQVVDIITCITEQSTNGTVSHLFVGNDDWTHMQLHQFLHILHLRIQREGQSTEDLGHHLRTDMVMVMEGPADAVLPPLRLGLPHIVHQCCPSQPQRVGVFDDVLQHFERMVEIILMCPSVFLFYDIEGRELRQDHLQES